MIIISDDEEMEEKVKSGNEVVESIINNNESEESIYQSLKNLLFISEYSDDEDWKLAWKLYGMMEYWRWYWLLILIYWNEILFYFMFFL